MVARCLLFDPALLSPDELGAGFLVRLDELERLGSHVAAFAGGEPRRHLHVLGAWGMGKSMLLARLALLCRQREDLAKLVPVVIGEETTRAGDVADVWLQIVHGVADALGRSDLTTAAASLLPDARDTGKLIEALHRLVEQALDASGRRLVLFVDGWDKLLEAATDPRIRRRLRDTLASGHNILVVASSTLPSAAKLIHADPLGSAFETSELPPLGDADVRALLDRLAAADGDDRLKMRLERQGGRAEALRRLAQGTPRLVALWYRELRERRSGAVADDLDGLVDALAPLHRRAVETLPRQARRVLVELARHWAPTGAAALSPRLRLGRNHVAAQLSRLKKEGWIEEVTDGGRRRVYRLVSRGLNLHLLLRSSPRSRRRVRLWGSFLEAIHGGARPAIVVPPPEALPPPDLNGRTRLRTTARVAPSPLGAARAETFWRLLSELPEGDAEGSVASAADRYADLRQRVRTARVTVDDWDAEGFAWLLCGAASLSLAEKERAAGALRDAPGRWLRGIDEALRSEATEFSELLGPSIWDAWTRATASGRLGTSARLRAQCTALVETISEAGRIWMADALLLGFFMTEEPALLTLLGQLAGGLNEDVEVVRDKLVDSWTSRIRHSGLGPRYWTNLGRLLLGRLELAERAEECFRRAVELDATHAPAWNALGNLLQDRKAVAEAEEAYTHAIAAAPTLPAPHHNLGDLLAGRPDRAEDAEKAYRSAIDLDPDRPASWDHLGVLLGGQPPRVAEAEAACRRALELDPERAAAWDHLADLLGVRLDRCDEAIAAYRRAAECDPHWAKPWDSLGGLMQTKLGRAAEAEAAYRRAIDLDPDWARPWADLARVLHHDLRRPVEADDAYRKAVELAPTWAWPWAGLGSLLEFHRGRYREAADAYGRATQLAPEWPRLWHDLGRVLHRHLSDHEGAETAFRRALDLEPRGARYWLDLGALLRRAGGRDTEAEEALRHAIGSGGGPEARNALARHLLHRGGVDGLFEALELARAAVAEAPNGPDARRTVVEVLVAQDRWADARIELEALLARADVDHLRRWGRAAIRLVCGLARRGHTEEVLELLKGARLAEWWEPVALALRVLDSGDDEPLRNASEEVASAAKDVVRLLETPADASGNGG